MTLMQRVIDVLMDWREYWIMPIVFPLSWLARMYAWLIRGTSRVTLKAHRERVARVAADIVEARARGATRLCSARPAKVSISTRVTGRFKRTCDGQIDVSNLNSIVEIDEVNGRMIVQPYVNMGTIADVLFPLGWTLPVMPEMEDLTIGGLCLGYGIESSSHRVGLFFEACVLEAEVVLGDGKVVVATPTNEHKELYASLPFSYGTLGFAVTFTLRIVKSKPFVALTLERVDDYAQMASRSIAVAERASTLPDFYEGLMFSPSHGALIYGSMCDAVPSGGVVFKPLTDWWDRWFYQYVGDETRTVKTQQIYMPIRDYTFRYSRSLFWEVELMAPFTKTRWFHMLFGWLLPPAVRHLKMLQTEAMFESLNKHHIVQDVLIPTRDMAEGLAVCEKLFDVWPLWTVFHAPPMKGGFMRQAPKSADDMFVDIGVWGVPLCILNKTGKSFDGEARTKDFEAFLRKVGGAQTLYATTFQTEEEFHAMFDHTQYMRLRKTYNADVFPLVYDKVKLRR